jgi:hypothetical protein
VTREEEAFALCLGVPMAVDSVRVEAGYSHVPCWLGNGEALEIELGDRVMRELG